MFIVQHLADALRLAALMFWSVLWPLVLGFLLSALVETLVPTASVRSALGRDTPRAVALAAGLGAASSSCSYAAVAVARSLLRRGASFSNAIIFEFASTNLVLELGLVLLVLLGWQFFSAELAGGIVMVVLLALLFRATLTPRLAASARAHAERNVRGRMEGHGAMDMSVTEGPLLQRAVSRQALTAISHNFYMSVYSLWLDLLLGFLIAGALAAWVPDTWWSALFLGGHGAWTDVWDVVVGPLIAMLTFVCSVGNVPLAAVLWRSGIGFGGAVAFIFGDLLILPILDIYRRYYGWRAAAYLFVVSLAAMACAGLLIDVLFHVIGAAGPSRDVAALGASITWNYDTFLDIAALVLALLLGIRFLRSDGLAMLRMMEGAR